MEKVNIPSVQYRQYPNSFLSKVALYLTFNSEESKEAFRDKLQKFLSANFDLNMQADEDFEAVRVTNESKTVEFFFSLNFAAVEFSGDNYKNYTDTQLPQLFRLIDYAKKIVHVSEISMISVRKLNTWDFKSKDDKTPSLDKVRNKIFSQDLISVLSGQNLTDDERKIRNFEKFSFDKDDFKITVRSAYIQNSKEKEYTRLILDTECLQTDEKLSLDDLSSLCKTMNKQLYDIYHWCVTNEVINMMNQQ